MKKLTLDGLRELRAAKKSELRGRAAAQVIIGMGTCGIAAGAQDALAAFRDELEKNNLGHVILRQTGCLGLCHSEPTVEVVMPGMPTVIYGQVTGEVARRIVREHLLQRALVSGHVFDKPAADLLK